MDDILTKLKKAAKEYEAFGIWNQNAIDLNLRIIELDAKDIDSLKRLSQHCVVVKKPASDKKTETIEEWLKDSEPKFRELHTYPEDWYMRKAYISKKFNYKCCKCGAENDFSPRWYGPRKYELHVHHIIPLNSGGDNSLDNLTLLCEGCHNKEHVHLKNRKVPSVYITKQVNKNRKPY